MPSPRPASLVLRSLVLLLVLSILAAPAPFAAPSEPPPSGESPATDEQLCKRGTAAYPANELRYLGKVDRGFDTGRSAFERLLREYPASPLASAAAYRLGLLLMDPANPRADLDEARTTFQELVR